MKLSRLLILLTISTLGLVSQVQAQGWPHQITPEEKAYIERIGNYPRMTRGITTPPEYSELRAAAEWEEIEALTISWVTESYTYRCILKQIATAAISECKVIIFTDDYWNVYDYLTSNTCGNAISLDNIDIVEEPVNSIWIRDYGANTVYGSWNDDRILVDWIYNRPRYDDDVIPDALGEHLTIDVYSTTAEPYDLMNTGGNYMSDGFGMAFESELITEENDGSSEWWTTFPDHTVPEIESIMEEFMGIHTLVQMETLPYDGIHHIDMHMKLLDESTLLVSEYPDGVADGPQINANLEYVLSNYTTKWGTPFEVIRIPSPPMQNGNYPDANGWYQTYSNAVFVNNKVILPTYYTEYDTTAIRIWEEALPGYEIVGIDCDSGQNDIISLSGAIHCITHSVGVEDPLMISHLPLEDTNNNTSPYTVEGYISHRSGIASATVHYALSPEGPWSDVVMVDSGNGEDFTADIPAQTSGSTIYYYISAIANTGKTGARPMPAPSGWWKFNVSGGIGVADLEIGNFSPIFPNPASAITCIPVKLLTGSNCKVVLYNALGAEIQQIHSGFIPVGERKLFFDASSLAPGAYSVSLLVEGRVVHAQQVMVK